ncbi:MAG: aldolase catalytic domain-containing protein [Kiritimatiellia bacterium]
MKAAKQKTAGWLTYIPELQVVDCTVRDGGLMNSHRFGDDFVCAVYNTCVEAGLDYMEFGYKASKKIFSKDEYGAWKFCDEEDLRRIVETRDRKGLKFCAMADAERTDYHTDILPKKDSVLDCIRVATYVHQLPTALDMVKDAHDKGYTTTLNLMAISAALEVEVDQALEVMAASEVDILYIVDSYGAFYAEQVEALMDKFKKVCKGTSKRIGIHTHNNQQMAYSNTITAIINGATMLDATLCGLGRGAGNCPMELLLGFLKNPKFDLRPVLQASQEVLLPMRKTMDWGYSIPYAITGQLNEHPRDAIKMRESSDPDNYVKFYDEMNE